jgi:phage terminase large subunit-like protein
VRTEGRRVAKFISHLTLGGSYLGKPFRLLKWQLAFLIAAYALLPSGRRKHRTVLLGVARKNGKTQLAAAIALYHLCDRAFRPMPASDPANYEHPSGV